MTKLIKKTKKKYFDILNIKSIDNILTVKKNDIFNITLLVLATNKQFYYILKAC